jgi:hypothetical protein
MTCVRPPEQWPRLPGAQNQRYVIVRANYIWLLITLRDRNKRLPSLLRPHLDRGRWYDLPVTRRSVMLLAIIFSQITQPSSPRIFADHRACMAIAAVVPPCAGSCRFVRVARMLIFPAARACIAVCCDARKTTGRVVPAVPAIRARAGALLDVRRRWGANTARCQNQGCRRPVIASFGSASASRRLQRGGPLVASHGQSPVARSLLGGRGQYQGIPRAYESRSLRLHER